MASPLLAYTDSRSLKWSRLTRCLRVRFQAGEWHLSEDGSDRIGGIFTSLSAAVAYARSELHGVPGGGVVLDFEGAEFDGQT